ncbi:hypothetical protein [Peribacillus simplex]|uniref:hypothetical protein n=1 Tax=Peribacillus simplex TaxID=1478 RepID=UPI00366BB07F
MKYRKKMMQKKEEGQNNSKKVFVISGDILGTIYFNLKSLDTLGVVYMFDVALTTLWGIRNNFNFSC